MKDENNFYEDIKSYLSLLTSSKLMKANFIVIHVADVLHIGAPIRTCFYIFCIERECIRI